MAKRRRRKKSRSRKSPARRRRRRRNATTAIVANPSRRRRRSSSRRRAKPRRRSGRRRRRNPTITFMDAVVVFAKGLAGGALAGGIDWGVSYAPVGDVAQSAIVGGGGLVTAVALAKWVDPAVGAGCAGGTVLAVMSRIRRMLALKDLGKSAKEEKTNGNGAAEQAQAVFRAKRESGKVMTVPRDAGRVFRARRESGAMTPFPGAATLPVEALARTSVKGNQQREASGSIYVPGGNKYGPLSQNWARHVMNAQATRYRDESGRVIRVRGAYN